MSGDLLVQPATSHGRLAPGSAVTSSFTVTNLSAHRITLQHATVTGIVVEGKHCTPRSADVRVTSATIEGVDGVVLDDLQPAVFTVDLTMGPHGTAACAGARFTPQVTVRGTDDAGKTVAGATTTLPTGWSKAGPPLDGSGSTSSTVLVGGLALWVLLAGVTAFWRGLVHRRRRRA